MNRAEASALDAQAVAAMQALGDALPAQHEKLPDGRTLHWQAVGGAGFLFPGARKSVRAMVEVHGYFRRNGNADENAASDARVDEVRAAIERWNANETSEWPMAKADGDK